MVVEIPLSENGKLAGLYTAFVDDEDSELAQYAWSVQVTKGDEKAYRKENRKHNVYLHRAVLERKLGRKIATGKVAIILDHNPLNCTRANLVEGTRSQANHLGRREYGRVGYRGVQRHPNGTYVAYIHVNNKNINLGYFETPEIAYEKRKKAEEENFGALSQHKASLKPIQNVLD